MTFFRNGSDKFLSAAFLILLCCFGLQVRDSLRKFLGGKKTTAVSLESEDPLEMPEVTFCPGFKREYVHLFPGVSLHPSSNNFFDYFPGAANASHRDFLEWWRNATFDAAEVFTGFNLRWELFLPIERVLLPEPRPGERGRVVASVEEKLEVEEVSATFGRCYTVRFFQLLSEKEYTAVRLGLKEHCATYSCGFYVHNPKTAYMGLNYNNWEDETGYFYTWRHHSYVLSLSKRIFKKMSSDGCAEDKDVEDYMDCVLDHTSLSYMNQSICETVCWMPQMSVLDAAMALPACSTWADYNCALLSALSSLGDSKSTGCLRPCRSVDYALKFTDNGYFDYSSAVVWFEVWSTDVAVTEEYLIVDLNDILSAVGGSLGLFLGFSCLEAVRAAARWIDGKLLP